MKNFFTRDVKLTPMLIVLLVLSAFLTAFLEWLLISPYSSFSLMPQNSFFWAHLAWSEFLLAFIWLNGFIMPILSMFRNREDIGSGYIALIGLVRRVARFSIVLFAIGIALPKYGLPQIGILMAQIIVFAYYIRKVIEIRFSQAMQTDGLEKIDSSLPQPAELAQIVGMARSPSMSDPQKQRMRNLETLLRASLPVRGKIAAVPEYQALCAAVQNIADAANDRPDELDAALNEAEKQLKIVKLRCR